MRGALRGPFGRYELGKEVVTLGRAPANTIVIDDTRASVRQAEVWPEGEEYTLLDVGSTHGTLLNGRPLQPHVSHLLHAGDVITIGAARIIVELAAVGAAHAPTEYLAPAGGGASAPTERLASSAGGGFAPTQPIAPSHHPADGASSGYVPPPPPPPLGGYGAPPISSAAPPYALPPPYVLPSPPRRRSKKKWIWLSVGGGLAFLVMACACVGLLLYTLYTHSPEGVTDAYYADIKSQDYTAAFQLLYSTTQQVLNLDAQKNHVATGQQLYIILFSCLDRQLGTVTAYATSARGQENGHASVNVQVTRAKEQYIDPIQLLQENKGWKIAFFLPPPNQQCSAVNAGLAAPL